MQFISKIQKYAVAIVLAVFIIFYFYRQGRQDALFQEKINQIEEARKSLQDSVRLLKMRTINRDEALKKLILRDLEIIDTLNYSLKKLNVNSKEIEKKINEHKNKIDELWKSSL